MPLARDARKSRLAGSVGGAHGEGAGGKDAVRGQWRSAMLSAMVARRLAAAAVAAGEAPAAAAGGAREEAVGGGEAPRGGEGAGVATVALELEDGRTDEGADAERLRAHVSVPPALRRTADGGPTPVEVGTKRAAAPDDSAGNSPLSDDGNKSPTRADMMKRSLTKKLTRLATRLKQGDDDDGSVAMRRGNSWHLSLGNQLKGQFAYGPSLTAPFLIIKPQSMLWLTWLTWLNFLATYVAFTLPVIAVFSISKDTEELFGTCDTVVDAVFLVHVVVTFFVGVYENRSTRLITNPREIAEKYVRGWFFLDLISAIPWLRMGVPGARILQITRMTRVRQIFLSFSTNLSIVLLRQILGILFLGHIFGCLWWYMGTNGGSASLGCTETLTDPRFPAGPFESALRDGAKVMCKDAPPYGLFNELPPEATEWPLARQVLRADSWGLTTVCSFASGMRPNSVEESLLVLSAGIAGVLIFAYLVGSIYETISTMSIGLRNHREFVSKCEQWIHHYNLDADVAKRILKYHRTKFLTMGSAAYDEEMLDSLPESLAQEAGQMTRISLLKKVAIFENSTAGLLQALSSSLNVEIATTRSYIVRYGEIGARLYIITHGTAEITNSHGEHVADVGTGEIFGEVSICFGVTRQASVRALTFMDLLSMSEADYRTLASTWEEFGNVIMNLARERYDKLMARRHRVMNAIVDTVEEHVMGGGVDVAGSTARIASMVPALKKYSAMANEVFLGGACGGRGTPTTWRTDIAIPMLDACGISYFNPQVAGDWRDPAVMAAEDAAKATCKVLLFVVSNQTRGLASMVEAATLLNTRQSERELVLVVQPASAKMGNTEVTPTELRDLNRGREFLAELAGRASVPVFDNVAHAIRSIILRRIDARVLGSMYVVDGGL